MQALRPDVNGQSPGPLSPGILSKKVKEGDSWIVVENLQPVDGRKDFVRASGGWGAGGVYHLQNGKRKA